MSKLKGAVLDRVVANVMGLKSVHNCEKWGAVQFFTGAALSEQGASMKTVIEMAREAGFEDAHFHTPHPGVIAQLKRLAELARAEEREACAKVADGFIGGDVIADRIRARSLDSRMQDLDL